MSDKWEDKGVVPNIWHDVPDMILPEDMQTHTHKVRNIETGKERLVRVDPGQSVGEAIAEGQWEDEED